MNLNDLYEIRDPRDAYERDVDNSTSGFGKDSYAYQQDGGANDENHAFDQQPTWYIRLNGKLIKDKQGNPYAFQDKAAANKAALNMQAKLFNKDKEFMLTTNPNDKPQGMAEGLVGAALGGLAGAALTKSPGGAMTGASIGSNIQDTLSDDTEVAEGFGANYAEQLAQKVFDVKPNLASDDDVLNTGYKVAVQDLMSQVRANHLFARDQDFPSDFASAYYYLQKRGVAEGHTEVKDKEGKVVSWKDDSEWHPAEKNKQGQPKDPRGVVTHMSDVARRKTASQQGVAEAEVDSDGHSMDHADSGEYDYEGDQAKDQLNTIVRAARRLNGMLDDNENMPEWVQMKITNAADYIDTAADYIESNQEPELDEGWKEKLGGAALAGAMALGAGSAQARVTPDGQGGFTGGLKPATTQQATDVAPAKAEAPKGYSKEYLQKAANPDRFGRYMISVEKAQELLKQMNEGDKIGNMDADKFDAVMARLKQLAGAGPMKTVYDPTKRVYRNVPTAVQPKK